MSLLLLLGSSGATASPTITSHPSSLTAYEYLTATFTVVATGGGLSYQWQKSDNAGVNWSDVSGATSSTYTTGALTRSADNSDQYRCVVTNSLGTVNSNAATLTVWSPAALTGLQLWLDSADGSTVLEGVADTAEDGDLITQWSDKSGNARHATASGTSRPTYRATGQNGRGSIEFNGTSNFFSVGTTGAFNFLHNGTDSLVVMVFKAGTASNPDTYYGLIDNCSASSANIGYNLLFDDRSSVPRNNAIVSFVAKGASGQAVSSNVGLDSLTPNSYHIYMERLRASNATASVRSNMYIDGYSFSIENNTLTNSVSASNHTSTTRIGSLVSGDGFLAGNCVEVIFCNNPNTSEWANVQRYLSGKWAIEIDDLTLTSLARISNATSAYDAFPNIYKTSGGLVTLFRSGTNHVGSKGTVTRSLSSDGGANWSVTANVITDATFDLRDANGLVLDNGDILCGTNLYVFGTPAAGSGGIYRSTDNGATFTQVSTVAPRSGYTMWYPFSHWHKIGSDIYATIYTYETAASSWRSEIWKTSDEGVTWSFVSQLAGNYNETSVINTSGNNWLAVARAGDETVNQMAYFTSSDNMATWSSATLTTFGVQAVSPNLVDWDGDIWLFVGDRSPPSGIKAYKWNGSGFTGGAMVYVAAGTDCGYPSAVIDSSNRMHLVFYQQYTTPGIQHYRITKN